jgi:hypothetical protein
VGELTGADIAAEVLGQDGRGACAGVGDVNCGRVEGSAGRTVEDRDKGGNGAGSLASGCSGAAPNQDTIGIAGRLNEKSL